MSAIRRSSISLVFGASHKLDLNAPCGPHLHGHQYTVIATSDAPREWAVIASVIDEFRNRDLNAMIPAGEATVDGLAAYLSERLAMHGIDEVEVHESDTGRAASVKRVPG